MENICVYKMNKNYFICTETMFYVGCLVNITKNEIILRDSSWVADTGLFSDALKNGFLKHVEPFPEGEIIIGRNKVVVACEFNHPLPKTAK